MMVIETSLSNISIEVESMRGDLAGRQAIESRHRTGSRAGGVLQQPGVGGTVAKGARTLAANFQLSSSLAESCGSRSLKEDVRSKKSRNSCEMKEKSIPWRVETVSNVVLRKSCSCSKFTPCE